MTINIKPPRILFSVTCVLLLVISATIYFSRQQLPPSIQINAKNQPTLGYAKARVHVIVFEEPKCSSCKHFNDHIFTSIKEDFIDTNKILYTVIPVSFLPGSMTAANALLCVYYENPLFPNDELFFKYLDYIYRYGGKESIDWATEATLVKFAKETSPAIRIPNLEEGLSKETYRVQIERNTAYGAHLMGGSITTPAAYVNGIKVPELTLENLHKQIVEVLEYEGVL